MVAAHAYCKSARRSSSSRIPSIGNTNGPPLAGGPFFCAVLFLLTDDPRRSAVTRCYNTLSLPEASAMSAPSCPHTRTILIAKDEHEEYLECLDCGEIFEIAEREPSSPGFNETLSDA